MARKLSQFDEITDPDELDLIVGHSPSAGKNVVVKKENLFKELWLDQVAGTVISFSSREVYNTHVSPGTGDITHNLTDASIGVTQKIYHNDSSAPNLPAEWVSLGGTYQTGVLNIIYAEYVTNSRIEYWIKNE